MKRKSPVLPSPTAAERNAFSTLAIAGGSQNSHESETPSSAVTTGNTDLKEEAEGLLSREERRKRKKLQKKQRKLEEGPSFHLNRESYAKAKFNCLKVKDLQNLVLWILADGINPSWLLIQNRERIRRVIYVMVPNLLPSLVYRNFDIEKPYPPPCPPHAPQLPVLQEMFPSVLIAKGPADKQRLQSPLAALLQVSLTQSQKLALRRELESRRKPSTIADFVLTGQQLAEHRYPEHREGMEQNGWTRYTAERKEHHHDYLAMDCEMCYTDKGLELTRVTIVDVDGKVVYDELVMPADPIVDYNTKFSGITKEMMQGVTKTLAEVQTDLEALIHEDTILIGHSLENDLKVLKIHHKRVVDTAILYHSSRGPPCKPKLQYLAQKHLNYTIQEGENGHDSVEDARACMHLALLKLRNGHPFGVVINDTESLFGRLKRAGKQSAMIDTQRTISQYGEDADVKRVVTTDEETLEAVQELLQSDTSVSFLWMRLRSLEAATVSVPDAKALVEVPGDSEEGTPERKRAAPPPPPPSSPISWQAACATLNRQLERLHSMVRSSDSEGAADTAIVVFSGHGDTRDASVLLKRRAEYHQLCQQHSVKRIHAEMKDKVFGEVEMQLLEKAVDKAKVGTALLALI